MPPIPKEVVVGIAVGVIGTAVVETVEKTVVEVAAAKVVAEMTEPDSTAAVGMADNKLAPFLDNAAAEAVDNSLCLFPCHKGCFFDF